MTAKEDRREKKPPMEGLEAFESYDAFLSFVKERFDLKAGEHEALYAVLLKLQHVGADPIKTMEDCRRKMVKHDCMDMLRFMIHVESLDLDDLKEMM